MEFWRHGRSKVLSVEERILRSWKNSTFWRSWQLNLVLGWVGCQHVHFGIQRTVARIAKGQVMHRKGREEGRKEWEIRLEREEEGRSGGLWMLGQQMWPWWCASSVPWRVSTQRNAMIRTSCFRWFSALRLCCIYCSSDVISVFSFHLHCNPTRSRWLFPFFRWHCGCSENWIFPSISY